MACTKTSQYLLLAITLSSLGLMCFLLSFATSSWLESDKSEQQHGFIRLGLWEACFRKWTHYKDPSLKEYDGCWYLLSSEFQNVRKYILRPWLQGVQVVLSLTLIMEFTAVLVLITVLLGILPEKRCFLALVVIGVAEGVAGIFSAACMVAFYVNSLNDLEWIENHEKHGQGWSFWLQLPSVFFIIGGGIFSILCAYRLRRSLRERPHAYPQ